MESSNSRAFFDEEHVQRLIAKIQNGQIELFEKLWMTFSKYVFWIMRSPTDGTKSLDEAAANLLTTDVCTELFKNIGKYTRKKGVSFISWLHKLALNMKRDYITELKRQPESLDAMAEEEPYRFESLMKNSEFETPLDTLIREEEEQHKARALALLPEVLNTLSPEDKFVVEARFFEGLSYEEISLRLSGDREKAEKFRKRKERTLRKLRDIFAECYGINEISFSRKEERKW